MRVTTRVLQGFEDPSFLSEEWQKPAFAIDLARRSPGEVLLRQLLLAAIAEGATVFDFGLGDEPFKHRFATRIRHVHTWGLYPSKRGWL